MLIGYARTSTLDQTAGLDAQQRDLTAAGCERTYVEQALALSREVGDRYLEAFDLHYLAGHFWSAGDRARGLALTEQSRNLFHEIKDAHARKQPVLVGTTSIEVSEMLSDQLREAGIAHEVLNAKQHEREAHIVANAGAPGANVTSTRATPARPNSK